MVKEKVTCEFLKRIGFKNDYASIINGVRFIDFYHSDLKMLLDIRMNADRDVIESIELGWKGLNSKDIYQEDLKSLIKFLQK